MPISENTIGECYLILHSCTLAFFTKYENIQNIKDIINKFMLKEIGKQQY